jgi:asparagine synthase (glutamine-hydrolysing)
MTNDDETLILAVNGEIYNHRALRKALKNAAQFKTHSDCEVIMHLVRRARLLVPSRVTRHC